MIASCPPPKGVRKSEPREESNDRGDELDWIVHIRLETPCTPCVNMEDGLRHRVDTESESEEDVVMDESPSTDDVLATNFKWCPLLTTVTVLVYFHGIALGWYLCAK